MSQHAEPFIGMEMQSPDTSPSHRQVHPLDVRSASATSLSSAAGPPKKEATVICEPLRDAAMERCSRAKWFIKEHWPRGYMHVFLYVGALVNFSFMWMWLSSLSNMECGTTATLDMGPVHIGQLTQCLIQLVGITIFGSSFAGSISMILYYDDSSKSLLKQKREKLVMVSVEMMRTLSDSLHLITSLLRLLQELGDEVLKYRWQDCTRVLKRCNIDTQIQQDMAKVLTECMYDATATALKQSSFKAQDAWTREGGAIPQVHQDEGMKFEIASNDPEKPFVLVARKGQQDVPVEPISHGNDTGTKQEGETTNSEAEGKPGAAQPKGDLRACPTSKYELFLYGGAGQEPQVLEVLQQMMIEGSANYNAFARSLLVKPWEDWVAKFEQDCCKFTDRFRQAGVYINLTQEILDRQVFKKHGAACPSPGCNGSLPEKLTKEPCFVCRYKGGAKYECATCCVHVCRECQDGLPARRKLQAIYASSYLGVLQSIWREQSDDEDGAAEKKVKEWQQKCKKPVGPAGQPSSASPSRPSFRRSTSVLAARENEKAPETHFCAVAGVKGDRKSGLGSCCGGCVAPWNWYFCLPCSFLRVWSRCARRCCCPKSGAPHIFDEEAPNEKPPRCGFTEQSKQCHLFCWKLDVNSYLHERFLIGATFSFLYALIQSAFAVSIVVDGCAATFGNKDEVCYVTFVKKVVGAFFLFVYFGSAIACLKNLELLDANFEFATDIARLQDLRNELLEFSKLKSQADGLKEIFVRLKDASYIPKFLNRKLERWAKERCWKCYRKNKIAGAHFTRKEDPDAKCFLCKGSGTSWRCCSTGCDVSLCRRCEESQSRPIDSARRLLETLQGKKVELATPSPTS